MLRNDAPDQEGDQRHDRNAPQDNEVELIDQRGSAKSPRFCDNAPCGGHELAQESQSCESILAQIQNRAAEISQEVKQPVALHIRLQRNVIVIHLIEQDAVFFPSVDEGDGAALSPELVSGAVQKPSARGIETFDTGEIERYLCALGGGDQVRHDEFHGGGLFRAPGA